MNKREVALEETLRKLIVFVASRTKHDDADALRAIDEAQAVLADGDTDDSPLPSSDQR